MDVSASRVGRAGDLEDTVGGRKHGLVVGHHLDGHNDSVFLLVLDDGHHLEGQIHLISDTVPHELELTIRGDEGDGAISIELSCMQYDGNEKCGVSLVKVVVLTATIKNDDQL